MAFAIHKEQQTMASITADRRLYVTADKSKVVEEGDPTAAYLLAGEGTEIPIEEAERLKLTVKGGKVVIPGTEKPKAEAKPKAEDKPKGAQPKVDEKPKAEDKPDAPVDTGEKKD